jgi:hypothetical protein
MIKFKRIWENELTEIDMKIRNKNNCQPIKIINKKDYNINIVRNNCEDGLPHTIDQNTIVIPENIDFNNINLINHEKVHLNQRKNINKWIEFYKKYWNYTIHKNPP